MDIFLKIFVLVCGLAFVGTVFYLLIKKKINERNSLYWIISCFVILILSAVPEILEMLSDFVGIHYPPALLFLFSTLILLLINLHHSIQISILNARLTELTQYVAINGKKDRIEKPEVEKNADHRNQKVV